MLQAMIKKQNPLRNAARLKKIVGVLASHGFQNVVERAKLGRFFLNSFRKKEDIDAHTMAERLRLSFEELGPTFIKLGQLLASRPDLIPKEFVEEFKRLHDQVKTVPFSEIEPVLNRHFGTDWKKIFKNFDENPLAAASIAQVYRAELMDGSKVVVKVCPRDQALQPNGHRG